MAEIMEGEKKWHQSSWSECEIWRENIVNWLAAGTSKLKKKQQQQKDGKENVIALKLQNDQLI